MEEPDEGSSEQGSHDEDHLKGQEGQRPEQLEYRECGPEEGGYKDPHPAEEHSEDGADPQHGESMRRRRAS